MKKRSIKKIISIILCLVTIGSLTPLNAVNTAENTELTLNMLKDEERYKIVEEADHTPESLLSTLKLRDSDVPEYMESTDLRDSNAIMRLKSKENDLSALKYLNSDGTISEYIMCENVKYMKDGVVFDKTNKLVYSFDECGYINPDNDIKFRLPMKYDKTSGVKIKSDKYEIEILPEKSPTIFQPIPSKNEDKNGDFVIYRDVFAKGVNVEYHVCFSGIKENIVLTENKGISRFAFTVETNGLVITDNGMILDGNDPVFSIGELIIFDGANNTGSGSIEISELEHGKKYRYEISVDDEFLNDENTVYPITVDPYITAYEYTTALTDVEIVSNSTSVNPSNTHVRIGKKNLKRYNRLFKNIL